MTNLPQKTREYDNHPIINGKRWEAYEHRPGDIVVATSYKAGTTWMQNIVANLIFQDGDMPAPVTQMSPWIDMDLVPLDDIMAGINAQTWRRAFKSHLPLDGISYYDTMKYIYVCRDGRDVFMSLWNHHSGYSDELKAIANEKMAEMGQPPFPFEFDNLHDLFAQWVSHSWYDWENDGYPYWSHFHHLQSWWDYRHLDNIHFVHFTDLLAEPETQVRNVAEFLNIEIDEAMVPGILERISFGSMKKNFMKIMPESSEIWKGGGDRFMNKGTNGRWQGVLTDEELAQYDAAAKKALTPDALHWLEHGGEVK